MLSQMISETEKASFRLFSVLLISHCKLKGR